MELKEQVRLSEGSVHFRQDTDFSGNSYVSRPLYAGPGPNNASNKGATAFHTGRGVLVPKLCGQHCLEHRDGL